MKLEKGFHEWGNVDPEIQIYVFTYLFILAFKSTIIKLQSIKTKRQGIE